MGQTRVDLQHLLEDLRDAYPGDLEETILSEIVANALDCGAARISVLLDPSERTLVVADDGSGMSRRELARYHDVASSSKTRGEGIGFAGVGIKLGLLAAEEVLTETRRGDVHVATRWRLASRQRAPWQWTAPPQWVPERGTAVGLRLRNALSPLLDAGYVEATLRRHFEPLLDHAFDAVLAEHYPRGVVFVVNGQSLPKRTPDGPDRATLVVKLPRKHKPSALGYLERSSLPLPEERQGVAVSTLGKVIRRGWDWLGQAAAAPALVAGLVEAPRLAEALTLNKGDFVRVGRRGMTYLAYRKAIQEAVGAQLTAWGESRDREDSARRKAARPVERDIEAVLVDLADDFPVLAALVERRAGGQRRLPTGAGQAVGAGLVAPARVPMEAAPQAETAGEHPEAVAAVAEPKPPPAESTLPAADRGPRRPGRYGLSIDFKDEPDRSELGRLVESTVWVNTAHPAYLRAMASRSEGYHIALSVGLALAAVAVEPDRNQEFITAFLARWGEALGRDRRRRSR
ncbi:MAG TPA: ATP-binding protein [Vicinamibacteria bacterium]|nr:ATP-binding protein [Vicinamibacteria bacterium]